MQLLDELIAEYYTPYLTASVDPQTNTSTNKLDPTKIKAGLIEWKDNKFGLFTPYKSFKDAGISWVLPIAAPIALGIAASIASAIVTLAAAAAVIGLIIAGGAALFSNEALRDNALVFAKYAGIVTGIAAAVSVLGPLLAWISTPVTLASALTRSGSTIVSSIANCVSDESREEKAAFAP